MACTTPNVECPGRFRLLWWPRRWWWRNRLWICPDCRQAWAIRRQEHCSYGGCAVSWDAVKYPDPTST